MLLNSPSVLAGSAPIVANETNFVTCKTLELFLLIWVVWCTAHSMILVVRVQTIPFGNIAHNRHQPIDPSTSDEFENNWSGDDVDNNTKKEAWRQPLKRKANISQAWAYAQQRLLSLTYNHNVCSLALCAVFFHGVTHMPAANPARNRQGIDKFSNK